jgi:hypothetical protein
MGPDLEERWIKAKAKKGSVSSLIEREPSDWNRRCLDSIRKEKTEVAKKYNIVFGQTEIYCSRCGRSVSNPGKHTCMDLRLEALKQRKQEKEEVLKSQIEENNDSLIEKIHSIGRSKTAIMLKMSPKTVSHWIDRGKIPKKYYEQVLSL